MCGACRSEMDGIYRHQIDSPPRSRITPNVETVFAHHGQRPAISAVPTKFTVVLLMAASFDDV